MEDFARFGRAVPTVRRHPLRSDRVQHLVLIAEETAGKLILKLDTTKPETIDLQGKSGKISATWHHAVVGRGDAVARRGSSGAAG